MRPVISVSLNGRAYQLEDDARAALADYLDSAGRSLAGNPDRAEILSDLEQAIADKCERCLNPHKNVIVRAEIEQVIREMGPVESGAAAGVKEKGASPDVEASGGSARRDGAAHAPKRLYQISDGAMLSGVCKGIAVYLDVDVTLVRLLFVIAAVLTGGLAVLVYVAMMFIVPYANTPEEHAAARGVPFNARVLVEQAKLKAAQLTDAAAHAAMANGSPAARANWQSEWRKARTQWRREWRAARANWRAQRWAQRAGAVPPGVNASTPPVPPVAHLIGSLTWVILGIVVAVLTVCWLIALISMMTTGALLGWFPVHVPLWVAIVGLIVLYQIVIWPLRVLRHASAPYACGHLQPWRAFWDAVIGLALLALVIWLLASHGRDVRHLFEAMQQQLRPAAQRLALAWQTLVHGAP